MSKLPVGVDQQQLYIVARRVLLDALVALQEHRDGVILIGAQAVYVHAADAHLGVAAYTSDGDLALDPVNLGQHPLIEAAMVSAGFSLNLRNDPGRWLKQQTVGSTPTNIMVDLLVPEGLSEGGRRSARIPPHDPRAFLRVSGIEAAIVDNRVFTLASLEPQADSRTVEVRVAGVAALLLSKAIKIRQRLSDSARPALRRIPRTRRRDGHPRPERDPGVIHGRGAGHGLHRADASGLNSGDRGAPGPGPVGSTSAGEVHRGSPPTFHATADRFPGAC